MNTAPPESSLRPAGHPVHFRHVQAAKLLTAHGYTAGDTAHRGDRTIILFNRATDGRKVLVMTGAAWVQFYYLGDRVIAPRYMAWFGDAPARFRIAMYGFQEVILDTHTSDFYHAELANAFGATATNLR